ncbi:hypothetical protein Tco_1254074 [Tanacetum coccineum]
MPCGTTQEVTRGASNDWCQMCRYEVRGGRASVRGIVAVRGVSTRQYEQSVRGKKFHVLAQHLQEIMEKSLPKMVDAHVQELTKTQVWFCLLDYKNLNKNDIKDLYLLIVNGKVDDYAETGLLWSLFVFIRSTVIWETIHDFQLGVESYQQKVNHTAITITFPGIKKYKTFSIVSKPVCGIIYKNSKKEKRVMRHQKVYKFCDATLKKVLEGLKSYNNKVKHGYVTLSLSKEDAEYLQLFEEEIEERLKHCDQMRC